MFRFVQACIALALLSCGLAAPARADTPAMAATPLPSTMFKAIWRTPLSPTAPLNANSATFSSNLRAQMAWPNGSGTQWFSDTTCGHPTYVVPANTPLTPVHVRPGSSNASTPDLIKVLGAGVPLPAGWKVNNCSDHQVAIYQPSSGHYWDFQSMIASDPNYGGQPSISWGGYMNDADTNPGVFRSVHDAQWHYSQWYVWGASATSIPLAAGSITKEDLQSGVIAHVLNIAVGHASCAGRFWPAQRHDCQSTTVPVPEGAWFRLPAGVNVDAAVAAFNPAVALTSSEDASARRFLRMLIVALRDYGAIVTDQTGGGVNLFFRDYGIAGGLVNWGNYYPRWKISPNKFWKAIPMNQIQLIDKPYTAGY